MNIINLSGLELKTFTEQDTSDYCQINNINSDDITVLYLYDNKLTDITGIKLFKNLEELSLYNNELTDISNIKYLNKLETLNISFNKIEDISVIKDLNSLKYLKINYLKLKSDQIKYINFCKNLKFLFCRQTFNDISVLNQLNKNIQYVL